MAGACTGRAVPRRRRLPATVTSSGTVVDVVVTTGSGAVVVVVVAGGSATVRITLGSKRPVAAVGAGWFSRSHPTTASGTASTARSTVAITNPRLPGRRSNIGTR